MSYQAYDVARLHGRDLVFWGRSRRNLIRTRGPLRLVLCNSYPKSGTHLLYQVLYGTPGLRRWDDMVSVQALCGIMNTRNHLRWKIGSAPDGSIVRCHLMHTPEVFDAIAPYDATRLFIYRDLRDVAVSHARWVTKEPRIFLHDIYVDHLREWDAQLMASIVGTPLGSPFGSNVSQPDIGQDFSRWLGWLDDPDTLAVRFEDLVGERGGGDEQVRLQTVRRVLAHVGAPIPDDGELARQYGSLAMDPRESHTFKKGGKGAIGGWRQHFTDEHKERFKAVAGRLLIRLGYEDDLDW